MWNSNQIPCSISSLIALFVCHQEETKSKFCSTFFSSRMSSCREAAVDKMIKCRLTQNIGEQTRSWFLKTDKTPLNKLFAYQLYMGHAFENKQGDELINTISTRAVEGLRMCRYGNRKYEVFGQKEVAMPSIPF